MFGPNNLNVVRALIEFGGDKALGPVMLNFEMPSRWELRSDYRCQPLVNISRTLGK